MAAGPADTATNSHFIAQTTTTDGPTLETMLKQLGYDPGKNGEKLQDALTGFGREHDGQNDEAKVRAVYQAAQTLEKTLTKGVAPGINLAQTHAVMVASAATHVPETTIANLAAAQRAFDPTFSRRDGRQPGLIQMTDTNWLKTVQADGSKFPRTAELAAEMHDANGKPISVTALPEDLKREVLALRTNPVIAAEIGTEYAKTNPVQLDTLSTYKGFTGSNKKQAAQLESLFAREHVVKGFNPGASYTEYEAKGPVQRESNPWCAAMANSVNASAGIPISNGGDDVAARDFQKWGTAVTPKKKDPDTWPQPGDIVMFRHSAGDIYHVAMVKSVSANGTFTWEGGNQLGAALGKVTEDGDASVTSGNVIFRRPPPNAFARAESDYQATQARQPAAPAAPAAPVNTTTAPVVRTPVAPH